MSGPGRGPAPLWIRPGRQAVDRARLDVEAWQLRMASSGVSHRLQVAALSGRLQLARALTSAADAKAGNLLSASGVLLTAGGVLSAVSAPRGPAAVLAGLAGAGLVVALLALLSVLHVRGGAAHEWLLPGQREAREELVRVAVIVTRKHRLLQAATGALAAAVLAGAAATAVAVAR